MRIKIGELTKRDIALRGARVRTGALLVIFAVCLVEVFLLAIPSRNNERLLVQQATSASFTELIRSIGASEAYALFREEYEQASDFSPKHFAAHEFGEALYETEGIEGIGVCDSSFGFGCFHSFFGRAIAEGGLSAAQELDAACIHLFGIGGQGCQHGIGHGLVEYLGHKRIPEALAVCASLEWEYELFGCPSGVFMEYNFPTLIDEQGARPGVRALRAGENYFSPCDEVAPRFRKQCLLSQVEWWQRGVRLDYQEMAHLCSSLEDAEDNKICFLGIGNSAAPALLFQKDQVRGACRQMPSEVTTTQCLSGAAWAFWDEGTFRDQADLLCADLGPLEEQCKQDADFTGTNI